jgi:hypothetical protein
MSNDRNRNAASHRNHSSYAATSPVAAAGTPPLSRLLAAYVGVLRNAGPEFLAASWCIQATRITHLVFGSFGVSVDPVITRVVCSNNMRRAQLGQWWIPIVDGQRPAEAHCGHMAPEDCPRTSGLWYGHLVPLVAGRYLVDAAIRQNQRPSAGIFTPDVLVHETDAFLDAGQEARIEHADAGLTTEIVYHRRESDTSFQKLEGWRSRDNHMIARDLAAEIRWRLEEDLALSHGIVRAGIGSRRVDPLRRAS